MVPFTFRIRVKPLDPRTSFEFVPAAPGIQQGASRRTFPGSRSLSWPSQAPTPRAPRDAAAPRSPASRRSAGLRPRGRPSSLSAPVLALLTPVRQVRRVQAPPAAATRRSHPVSCTHPPAARIRSLVLRRKPPSLGLLDQLRIRHPRRRGAPASHETSARLRLAPLRGRRLHPQLHSSTSPTSWRSPFSPSRFIDSSMVSVSPDVDRSGADRRTDPARCVRGQRPLGGGRAHRRGTPCRRGHGRIRAAAGGRRAAP